MNPDHPSMPNQQPAKTPKGRAKISQILEVARSIFIQGGYAEMTMRQVAERSGITLSNLQHYFPTRENLLQGLLEWVTNSYDPPFSEIEASDAAPAARLEAALRYFLQDAIRPETERLFVEIWSLATRDAMVRTIFDKMYTHQRQNLGRLLASANPGLSHEEVQQRAALASMQIEGLMLLISENKPKHPELAGIDETCVNALMHLLLQAPGSIAVAKRNDAGWPTNSGEPTRHE